tara:strand:- start:43 stop:1398 length:1356 start_codon:yes stop_codon:yes gene_type:complete
MKNIIVFFNDDHGQWALPSYGNKDIRAPNIDYLSDNGVQFNNSFTPTPVCSPSRASFFTGLRASDHGVHDFIGEPGRDKDWLKDFNTLPSLLKTKFNYDTSIFGKWHLGQDDKKRSYFNHWFVEKGVYPFSHKMSHSFKENNTSKEIYGFRDQIITEKFNEWIKERKNNKPFFSFIGFNGTHSPWEGHPKRLVDFYQNKDIEYKDDINIQNMQQVLESETYRPQKENEASLEEYYASISHIDECVGRIMDTLEVTNLIDETIIIYTSDHGLCCGHHGVWGKSNGTIPSNLFEESIRIPLIIYSGANIVSQKRDNFVDHLDTYATIIDIIDPDYYKRIQTTGKSFKKLLLSKAEYKRFKEVQIIEYGNLIAIKKDNFKYIVDLSTNRTYLSNLDLDSTESLNFIKNKEYKNLVPIFDDYFNQYKKEVINSKYSVFDFKNQVNISGVEPWLNL